MYSTPSAIGYIRRNSKKDLTEISHGIMHWLSLRLRVRNLSTIICNRM